MHTVNVRCNVAGFSTAGERIVLILSTDESRVLAVAKLNVVASSPNSQVKVFVIPASSGGSTTDTVRQMVQVLSNQTGSGPNPFLTCGSLYCLGGQEHEATGTSFHVDSTKQS